MTTSRLALGIAIIGMVQIVACRTRQALQDPTASPAEETKTVRSDGTFFGPWTEGETIRFQELGIGKALAHESQETAIRRAKDEALAKAMRQASDTFYGFTDYSEQMGASRYDTVARHLFTSSQGVLVEESPSKPECAIVDRVTTCKILVRGTIVFRGRPDPSFIVTADLDRRQYYDQEPVRLKLAVSQDAHIQLFSWDAQDNVTALFPNRHQRDSLVKGGAPVSLPPGDSGLAYRASLPKGASSTTERLVVLASKKPLLAPMEQGLKLADVMRRLAQVDRADWTMQVTSYEIQEAR